MTILIDANKITFPDNSVRGSSARALVVDQKAFGTHGGGAAAGAQTRNLNTKLLDDIGIVVAGDGFQLPAGTYFIELSVPGYLVNQHKAWLARASDTATPLIVGSSEYSATGTTVSWSRGRGRVVLAVPTTLVIRHYAGQAQSTNGLGVATALTAAFPEIYTQVYIEKEL